MIFFLLFSALDELSAVVSSNGKYFHQHLTCLLHQYVAMKNTLHGCFSLVLAKIQYFINLKNVFMLLRNDLQINCSAFSIQSLTNLPFFFLH